MKTLKVLLVVSMSVDLRETIVVVGKKAALMDIAWSQLMVVMAAPKREFGIDGLWVLHLIEGSVCEKETNKVCLTDAPWAGQTDALMAVLAVTVEGWGFQCEDTVGDRSVLALGKLSVDVWAAMTASGMGE